MLLRFSSLFSTAAAIAVPLFALLLLTVLLSTPDSSSSSSTPAVGVAANKLSPFFPPAEKNEGTKRKKNKMSETAIHFRKPGVREVKNRGKQQQHNEHVNEQHRREENLEDVPWSWSGSSWSMSSMSSGSVAPSSSSSSSSSSNPTTTTLAPTTTTPGGSSSSSSGVSTTTTTPGGGSSSSSSQQHPGMHKFRIFNNCTGSIWVALLGNPGFQTLMNGGFEMTFAGPPVDVYVPQGWQGRIWARVDCNFTATGQCNPPYQPCCLSGSCLQADGTFGLHCAHSGLAPTSLIEMSLDNDSPLGPYDVYDTSLVDGWSVPLGMQPVQGTYNTQPDPGVAPRYWCTLSGCYAAPECPQELNVNGQLVSCYSPCQAAVNSPNTTSNQKDRSCCVCTQSHPNCNCQSSTTWGSFYYGCCVGGYGCSPSAVPKYPGDQTCDPWSTVPGRGWKPYELQYITNVKSACPNAYSWQFSDLTSTMQCRKTSGLVDYDITFVTRLRDGNTKDGKKRTEIRP